MSNTSSPDTSTAQESKEAKEQPRIECVLCRRKYVKRSVLSAANLRAPLSAHIVARYKELWSDGAHICYQCLHKERTAYVILGLERERGELSRVEQEISRKATEHVAIAARVDEQFQKGLTFGQRLADMVARVGGSWTFVSLFLLTIVGWAGINIWWLKENAFDPFPFILLNLVLSCLAAVQAPIIMMSQGRMAARDRMQADLDYQVNLKAEIEIASLHEKVDHLLNVQWDRMVELQQTQIDILNEMVERRSRTR